MLQKNKTADGKGKFELRKVERDSEGNERYIKTEEDAAILKAKMQQMQVEVLNELKGVDFDTRFQWVLDRKADGNQAY